MLIEMKVDSLAIDPLTNIPILILKNDPEERTLPIWIGILEASAIAMELENVSFARPITHELLNSIMSLTKVEVLKVEVTDVRENVYYASIHLRSNGKKIIVDSRPSDAIAIALRAEAPIFVESNVLDRSIDISVDDEYSIPPETQRENLLDIFEDLSPEDFSKYKM